MNVEMKEQIEYEMFRRWISRIYIANIAMNNEAIKEVIGEISSLLHISEGEDYLEKLQRWDDNYKPRKDKHLKTL